MFPSTGVREEGQLWNHHTLSPPPPFHNPYLILCFLFSVTIGPSWCVLGRCQDGDSKPAEFHSKWQPVKDWCLMKKLRGGRRKKKKNGLDSLGVRLSSAQAERGAAKNASHRHVKSATVRSCISEKHQFLETLPDQLQSSFALIPTTGCQAFLQDGKVPTLWYAHKHHLHVKLLLSFWRITRQLQINYLHNSDNLPLTQAMYDSPAKCLWGWTLWSKCTVHPHLWGRFKKSLDCVETWVSLVRLLRRLFLHQR